MYVHVYKIMMYFKYLTILLVNYTSIKLRKSEIHTNPHTPDQAESSCCEVKEISKDFNSCPTLGDKLWIFCSARLEGFPIKTPEGPWLRSKSHVPELRAVP